MNYSVRKSGADKARSWLILVLALAQPVAGRLAQLTGKGRSIEARADTVEGPITPAKGAFAIWGALFAGNLWFSIKSLVRQKSSSSQERRIEWLNALTLAGNTAWSLQAQYAGLGWPSFGIIATSAMSAAAATIEAERAAPSDLTRVARWTDGPLAGWLTVATFANLDGTLTQAYGRPLPEQGEKRAMMLISGASATAAAVALASRGNSGYTAAAGWGLGAIMKRNLTEHRRRVAATAAAGAGAVVLATLLAKRHQRG
jgi:hypothetical protein